MISKIIYKELLENINSTKFRTIAIIIITTILISGFLLTKDYKTRLNDFQINKPKIGESRVSLKPSVLSIFFSGISKKMEEGVDIKPGTLIMLPSTSILEFEFFSSKFPIPDIGYIVKIIMSLLVIIFAFDSISGEKSTGTLKLIFSNSISRSQFLIGKFIGHITSIYIPFVFSFILLIVIIFILGVSIDSNELFRIILFFLASLLYISIFVAIALFVSSNTIHPSTSLVVCLIIWVSMTYGITNLSDALSRNITHLKAAQSLEEEKLLLFLFQNESGTNIENNANTKLFNDLREKENNFRNQLSSYLNLVKIFSRFSPIGAYTLFATNMTNSGLEDEEKYKRSVLEYRDLLIKNSNSVDKIIFNYKPNELAVSLENTYLDIISLFLFQILFLLAGFVSFQKYDIR